MKARIKKKPSRTDKKKELKSQRQARKKYKRVKNRQGERIKESRTGKKKVYKSQEQARRKDKTVKNMQEERIKES